MVSNCIAGVLDGGAERLARADGDGAKFSAESMKDCETDLGTAEHGDVDGFPDISLSVGVIVGMYNLPGRLAAKEGDNGLDGDDMQPL